MNALAVVRKYEQISDHDDIMAASPHRLIQMLMEGFLEKTALAKAYMASKHIAEKGETIGKAIAILNGLQASLNLEAGGQVAENLNNLYGYMSGRMVDANLRNDANILDEAAGLMTEIKAGWDNMPESFKY
jgi:flagellar protein FliS